AIRQVLRDPLPAFAFVGARPDIAVRGSEVKAHRIEAVVVHAFADRFEGRTLGQSFVEPVPGLALVARAVDADTEGGRRPLHAIQRDDVRALLIARVDRGGGPEVRREARPAE